MKIHGTITSTEDFNKLVGEIRSRRAETIGRGLPHRQEYFRGQLDVNWSVKPSLSRDITDPKLLAVAEEEVIKYFKKQIQARDLQSKIFLHASPQAHQNEWAWMMQAQHLGIPTRMLDWTLKPEVALYFAVDNPAMDGVDGQLLVCYMPFESIKTEDPENHQYYSVHPRDLAETWFLNPAFYADFMTVTPEIRRARQHGKFTMQPYSPSVTGLDAQPPIIRSYFETFDPVVEKYIIPAGAKAQIRLDLASQGWYGEYLYANDEPEIEKIREECKKIVSDISKS